jgi:hypothetical protein
LEIKAEAGASESNQIAKDESHQTPESVIDGLNFDPMRNSSIEAPREIGSAEFVRED